MLPGKAGVARKVVAGQGSIRYICRRFHRQLPAFLSFLLKKCPSMQKNLLLLPLMLMLAALAPGSGLCKMVDRNVAIVNGETITLSEINELAKPVFDKIRAESPPGEVAANMAQARRAALARLIDKRLVAQEAARYRLQVTDEELDKTLEQIRVGRNMSPEDQLKELRLMGVTEQQYREEMRTQMLGSKVINAVVRTRVLVTDEEILARYLGKTSPPQPRSARDSVSGNSMGKMQLLQLGVLWGAPGRTGAILTKEQARSKIEKLRKVALTGASFSDLARLYSDLPTAGDGGSLGSLSLEDMAGPVRAAVQDLDKDGISQPVEANSAFLIFKRLDGGKTPDSGKEEEAKTAEDSKTAEETGTEEASKDQVAVVPLEERERIKQEILREKMEGRVDEWIQELRKKAYIKLF